MSADSGDGAVRLTIGNSWAIGVAEKLRPLQSRLGVGFVTPHEFGDAYRYSDAQAAHVLRRAVEYGTVERAKRGRAFVYRAVETEPGAYGGHAS